MADYGVTMSLSQAHTSDDDDSDNSPHSVPKLSGGVSASSSNPKKLVTKKSMNISGGSSSAEMSKKPRGRPPGSKNKPKPPVVITKDHDSSMRPVIIEISAGADVVETLIQFARRRHVGISVLSGSGSVSNVTLRHPQSHAPSISLHGPFSLLSLSGSFMASPSSSSSSSSSPSNATPSSSCVKPISSSCSSFGICLAGSQGQVFGGIVGGKVVAASLVVVVAAMFLNPSFHRLPAAGENDEAEEVKPGIGSDQPCVSSSGGSMSMAGYNVTSPAPINCHGAHDVMPWTHSSRPPY